MLLHDPGSELWEQDLFESKYKELSLAEFAAWMDGYNYIKYGVNVDKFPPPYGIAKFDNESDSVIHCGTSTSFCRSVLLNGKILGDWKTKNNGFSDYKFRENVVYVQKESNINLGGGNIFSGWSVLQESVHGDFFSYSFHTRLLGDKSKLTIENIGV
jgi:hypothetical protein